MSGASLLQGRRFLCREWALEKLRRWLESRPAGILVTGGPGAGKTALCTEMTWPTSEAGLRSGLAARCLAAHFCQREDEKTLSVWMFVLGLVEQLRTSPFLSPGYGEALDRPDIASALDPLHCQGDPDDTFKRAVLLPLLGIPPPSQSCFLLVDAVDSASVERVRGAPQTLGRSSSIAELLSSHRHLLPGWLLLICSARRQNKAICKMFSAFHRLTLDDLRKAPAVRDVQQYILCRLDQEGALRSHLIPETADMLNLLHIKSGGCFLFLERVLDGVAEGLMAVREIRDIPGTLNGLYLWLCQRLFPRKAFSKVRPLLCALLASPCPLTPEQLYAASWAQDASLCRSHFQRRLDMLATLLTEGPGGTRLLFHSSFAEWLTDVKYCTQRYLCAVTEGHTMLAMALTLRAPRLGTEEVCQLATHLVSSGVHANDPALLALWMLYAGLPSVSSGSSSLCPVQEEVLQLLVEAGVYPTSSLAGSGHGDKGEISRRTLERVDSVRTLLDSGADVNWADPSEGHTLLAGAAQAGSAEVVELLLSRGADPSLGDSQGQTPLILAARQGHVKVLRALLTWAGGRGAEGARMVDHADVEGWTALRSAAWGGHTEVVCLLLAAGADVDGCDSEGRTALRAAAWGGHEEILLTLLDSGAQVDKPDREGRTPLIAAAYMGQHEAVEILLDRGAEVDRPDGDGRTALSVAAMCVPSASSGSGYGDVVGLLLDRGADPGHKDRDGMTPLLLAAYEGHLDVVEQLLEAGADLEESTGPLASGAVTPLLAAASMGHMGVVASLLYWGAAVDAIDAEGRTALSLAATRGSTEVVRALLDRGLDENHKDHLGWTPLHAAACGGHRGTCATLTEPESMARVDELDKEGQTPLILAAQEGHCGTVRLLLDRRASIDHRGYDGHSPLSAAALEGHTEVVELLMRRGADTDVRDSEGRPLLYLLMLEGRLDSALLLIEKGGAPLESRDAEGRTALHVASWQGNLAAMDLLLKHGADPNAQDMEGRSPLHSVAWQGNAAAARLLLEARGALVDLACEQQKATALCIAAQEGHTNVVATLLDNGANPDHSDRYGRSPVKVAEKNGHAGIVELLESYGATTPRSGILPSPLRGGTAVMSSTVKITSSAGSRSNGEGSFQLLRAATTSLSSLSCSPGSTAERFHSTQSSQTSSSTYHSLATVQTVPADSLSFTQQIQQHSLSRSRGRPSTLLSPGSAPNSQYGSSHRPWVTSRPPPTNSVPAPVNPDWSQKGSPVAPDYGGTPGTPVLTSAGPESEEKGQASLQFGGRRWNSVMASLGVMPGMDHSARPPKTRDSPPLGYPIQLGEHRQQEAKKGSGKEPFSFSVISSPSALPSDSLIDLTTTDPQLHLKQAIKLQFEGPTSAVPYKRETPL